MTRSMLLTIAAWLASVYLAVGATQAWMIWPLTADCAFEVRSRFMAITVTRWPVFVSRSRQIDTNAAEGADQ